MSIERNYLAEFEYANKHEVENRQSAHSRECELFGYKINSCTLVVQDTITNKIHELPAMWGGIR